MGGFLQNHLTLIETKGGGNIVRLFDMLFTLNLNTHQLFKHHALDAIKFISCFVNMEGVK